MRIEWDTSGLERKIQEAFRDSVVDATGASIEAAPVRRGDLRRSITFQFVGRFRALIGVFAGPASKYAAAQELGARPHVIRVRRKKTLRFDGDGGPVFAKQVNHPGNPPVGYLQKGRRVFYSTFADRLRRLLNQGG